MKISGTVELPAQSSDGRLIQLEVYKVSGIAQGVQRTSGVHTTLAKSVKYEIRNLPSSDYKIRLQVDETGNQFFDDVGDFDGWYAGSTSTPVQDQSSAQALTLVSVSRDEINFGIGEKF